jgi:hypothetical protein
VREGDLLVGAFDVNAPPDELPDLQEDPRGQLEYVEARSAIRMSTAGGRTIGRTSTSRKAQVAGPSILLWPYWPPGGSGDAVRRDEPAPVWPDPAGRPGRTRSSSRHNHLRNPPWRRRVRRSLSHLKPRRLGTPRTPSVPPVLRAPMPRSLCRPAGGSCVDLDEQFKADHKLHQLRRIRRPPLRPQLVPSERLEQRAKILSSSPPRRNRSRPPGKSGT